MKNILIGIASLLVVGGGGYWVYTTQVTPSDDNGSMTKNTENTESMDQGESLTGSLREMINLGTSLKCTWSVEDTSGSSWIKGGKVYSEVSTSEGQFYSITKDSCIWSWGDATAAETGFQTCFDSESELYSEEAQEQRDEQIEDQNQQLVEPPADVNYNCENVVINDSRFNPPSAIEFVNWEDLMQGSMEEMQESMENIENMEDIEGMMPEGF